MSPTSTARHRLTARKIAICAAALVVAVLPMAYGAAYADDNAPEVVEVGGAEAADGESGDESGDDSGDDGAAEDGGAEDGGAEDGGAEDGGAEDGGAEDGAGGDAAAEEDAGAAADENKAENADTEGGNGNNNANDNGNGNQNGNGNGGGDNNGNGNDGGNGLDVLGTDCSNSDLEPHDGFEKAPRCVDTSFGEVAAAEKNPSLLITESPDAVQADEEFSMTVGTRNLVRDRFLDGAGGYYKESSFLNEEGIQRGHFHTACRMLEDPSTAPNPAPEPEFFLATQDNGGGVGPDEVKITVSGLPAGTAQCAVWAGDGSHRTPMMQRANQVPAFDAVRITVE
jgi:hypothetical protein